MKSVSAHTSAAIDSPHPAPILLVDIDFTSPSSLTLNLCSRPFETRNTFNDIVYDPLISSWSPVRCGEIKPDNYYCQPGEFSLDILNSEPLGGYNRFSNLLAAYDWAYATVTVSIIHEGAMDPGDEVTIFKGKIENPENMTLEKVSLKISDIGLSYMARWPHTIVTTDDYADADPDDIGKMLPQVWGSCQRVPFMAVDAGWMTTLAQDLAKSATGNIDFTDVSGLPASGTVQIDAEQMTYGSK
ncbi:MAG: hypothetical protein SV375_00150, partial [Thermodesulfobacteriota bacterium]|nr:hypothetical protein [Thermodesulfobacteriota bacterium]